MREGRTLGAMQFSPGAFPWQSRNWHASRESGGVSGNLICERGFRGVTLVLLKLKPDLSSAMHFEELRQRQRVKGSSFAYSCKCRGRTPPSGTNRGQPRLRRRFLLVLIAVLLSASVNTSNTKENKKKKTIRWPLTALVSQTVCLTTHSVGLSLSVCLIGAFLQFLATRKEEKERSVPSAKGSCPTGEKRGTDRTQH